ncbi:hypothetical protein AAF712_014624 [Marasmius tenuissimus]|uniref:Uncharacterized protein n=1 Tax=Marasmius tenuissimus TaxID=585030 RepID=A0ABR2ZAK6_9AGAR
MILFPKQSLAGIIYLHRAVSSKDVDRISPTEFGLLRKLCGRDTLEKLVIVTNGWEEVPPKDWESRQTKLRDIFQLALKKGAKMTRHRDDTPESRAIAIVERLIGPEQKRLVGVEGRRSTKVEGKHLLDRRTDLKDFMNEYRDLPPSRLESGTGDAEPVDHPTKSFTETVMNMSGEDLQITNAFFGDEKYCRDVLNMRDAKAQEWLDLLQGVRGAIQVDDKWMLNDAF